MKYKYIHFEERTHKNMGGKFYACCNNKSGDVIGFVLWYKPWKQWVFSQAEQDVVFSRDCLADIIDFMGKIC